MKHQASTLSSIIQSASHLPLPLAAELYATHGVPVFPCGQDKAPITTHGFHDASTDVETIRKWWQEHPDALVGMPTGDGVVVVDIDVKKGDGFKSAAALNLSNTFTVGTRSGGAHWYYEGDGRCTTDLVPYVDIRASGGYVIVPPSAG